MAHRMVFSEVVGTLSFLQPESDDDIADRLHYYYTSTFLLVTAVLISIKMFGGRPIECWLPAEYKASWEDYTEIYCWAKSTYFVNFATEFPTEEQERQRRMVSYYQWTPFFLVFCALLFYSPCLLWRLLYGKSGIRIKDIVAFATDRSNIQPRFREANVKGVAAHLGSVFQHRFRWGTKHPYHHKVFRLLNLRFYEAYLTLLYIGIKMLFLANVLAQMYLMNWFLQTDDYNFYGWGVIQDLIHGRPWSESGNFPRVTYCDLDIRILGNIQKHTVQCVLVINIFIEKVFIMLWVWYSFLVVVTLTSLTNWIFASIPFDARKRFIARRLELADVEFKRKEFKAELDEFVRDFIKMDGVFVLKMITIHAGILVCTEILSEMWDEFLEQTGNARVQAECPLQPRNLGLLVAFQDARLAFWYR
ncbi:CBN-INX-20 protein [Aphelenchoides avenae]|nr:CBN-INX-20 protein [Aphelenchus avenae]